MGKDDSSVHVPTAGGSSLLMIFAVLCLVVFAVLGLATLQADRRLFDSLSGGITDFYAADVMAQEMLRDLRKDIIDEGVVLVTEQDGYREFSYQVPVSGEQALSCLVRIYTDSSYEILTWNTIRFVDWNGDFDTPVFTE